MMNRKHNTNGSQNQGWVTLNDQQLRQIDGGVEQHSFNFEQIKFEYNPSRQVASNYTLDKILVSS